MVQINFGRKEVSCKVVFYGPGMSGKTTNLEIVHQKVPEQNRGDLTSISTDGDRTLFFDYMPLDLGSIAGMHTKFQLYTVPGQVYYNSTRKLVLQGVDGVVFVADSSPSKRKENLESLKNLEENLREYGKELKDTPHVIQCNKRDLPDAMPVAEMLKELNPYNTTHFEAVAATGQGVFPTLKALASLVLESVNRGGMRTPAAAAPKMTAVPASAASTAPAVAATASAGSGGSAFTRNAPPGMAKGFAPSASEGVSAEKTPAPLPNLMAPASNQAAPVRAAEAPQVSPAARVARAPLPLPASRPAPRGTSTKKRSVKKAKSNLGMGLLFGGLVLAAAAGIVILLLS